MQRKREAVFGTTLLFKDWRFGFWWREHRERSQLFSVCIEEYGVLEWMGNKKRPLFFTGKRGVTRVADSI